MLKTGFGNINSNRFEKLLLIGVGIFTAIAAGATVYFSLYYPVITP